MMRRAVVVAFAFLAVLPSFRLSVGLSAQDTIPAGYGSLRRDDVAVRITTDELGIQVLPLPEGIIRLLAPDTYRSLRDLIHNRHESIDSLAMQIGVPHPTLVLVTFASSVQQGRFNPEDVNITSAGQLFRPVGIVPVSPRWGAHQLDAQEQASAIYLFDEGIVFREDMRVSYQNRASQAWRNSVRILDQERARVRARARTEAPRD